MENLMFNEYKNSFATNSEEISIKEIIEKIRTGYRIKAKIKLLRNELQKKGKNSIFKRFKSELPAFIIAGKYLKNSRESKNLQFYNGWMVFDIDNIQDEQEYQRIFNKIKKYSFVRVVFRSPSGKGMKIIVVTDNNDSEKHPELYKRLMKYFESVLNVKFDETTYEVNRLCFYSYDPEIFYNENSEVFEFETLEKIFQEEVSPEIFDKHFVKEIEYAIRFTNNVLKFEEGYRNKYIYLLGENCNGYGIDKVLATEYCVMKYVEDGFSEYEIEFALENGFTSEKYEFGQWRPKLLRDIKMKIEIKSETSVFEKFSSKLNITFSKKYQDVMKQLKTENDKEMFILGMITTLETIYKIEEI
ncbi:hypothetical protein N6B72_13845 [Chryseobacterium soli]|uniref:BT4734/BF3469 family protein n=1 Tax=Chryseobacterium soli TaxID=445961 RepID=UPI002954782E|nr:BT4734/BF3469 family protein [Chryseobacterium soli]MDV7698004.1 hypothetical protein [Chryseobacterium soli]